MKDFEQRSKKQKKQESEFPTLLIMRFIPLSGTGPLAPLTTGPHSSCQCSQWGWLPSQFAPTHFNQLVTGSVAGVSYENNGVRKSR